MFKFVLALATMASPAWAHGLNNGGDYVAAEFIARGYRILDGVEAKVGGLLSAEQFAALRAAVAETPVEACEDSLRDYRGIVVDARNVAGALPCDGWEQERAPGPRKIQLHRPRWLAYHLHRVDVYRLVFHEYLLVVGIDDDNFKVSSLVEGTFGSETIGELMDGRFEGTGRYEKSNGESGIYATNSAFTNGQFLSVYSASGTNYTFRGAWAFLEPGSFLLKDGLGLTIGNGECNEVQCQYTVPSYRLQETFTFYGEKIERSGKAVVLGQEIRWFDVVERRR